jgi:CheY-like chemotaxis protein
LLETILPTDLNGTIELDFCETGVRCVFSFPIEAAGNLIGYPKIGRSSIAPREDLQPGHNGKSAIAGKRILLLEDEAILGLEISEILSSAGAHVIGPFGSLTEGTRAARRESIDVAVLDMNLNGQMVYPVAEELQQRKIPVLFLTGYDVPDMPKSLHKVPHVLKPVDPAQLLRLIAEFGQ